MKLRIIRTNSPRSDECRFPAVLYGRFEVVLAVCCYPSAFRVLPCAVRAAESSRASYEIIVGQPVAYPDRSSRIQTSIFP